ncbi:type III secretion system (T3SS) SseB-like protein [Rhodoglobus vestalii]|uniref:Type III secretion system (T3SS) SseB-like protein n=1 Tax=Rhodoglobus vestalii TaxID=193384 RepID=A0A8H2K6I8_9MICO|nr:SseB family protein [Rhodoglobus vestalii]TQO18917.1 type III secretion system (T3SS) SseB-like protein [Rhodoglobus vestalii]
MNLTDSAGVPWEGRSFDPNPAPDDDGTAPPKLMDVITRFQQGDATEAEVVDVVRESRLLIPLLAKAGETTTTDAGLTADKTQELSIVTVTGPDGRAVLPVFSSVTAMSNWNPEARPVPAAGTRVALAAASENTDLVIIDPLSDSEFVVRRPALWSIAQSTQWVPSFVRDDVRGEFMASAADEPDVAGVQLLAGDPGARLHGPELVVQIAMRPGLDRETLDATMDRMRERWASSELIAQSVDSLAVQVVRAPEATL